MNNTDTALIHRTLDGDDNAFAELVKKYQKQVHALIWRKMGDFHIAEELTQDVFLKAYQRLATLKKPQSFASWLYVIASNDSSTWLRKKRLWTQSLEDTSGTQLEKATYSGYVIEENERAAAEAQRDVVKKLLAKLQESERTVMTLYYFGEMTCREISEFLGVSVGAIKSRLDRARHRLEKEEPMIREALEHFQLTPHLTENIMREIARTKPIAPSGGKPFVPWAIVASTVAAVFLMLGIGNHQYAIHFQQPYSFDATSDMTVELIEAPLVANLVSKSNARTQLGNANAPNQSNTPKQQPSDAPALYAEAQTDEITKDYTQWALPKEAKKRFGKGSINALQFSPDGTQLAVGSKIGIWLYDVETGKELSLFEGMCQSLAFSPDGHFLASGGGRFRGKELQLWDLATGQKVPLIDGQPSASALRFSEDGETLVSLGNQGDSIGTLDVKTRRGNVMNIKERSADETEHRHTPELYALTHDKFAVGGTEGKIELWNTTTGKKIFTLRGHPEKIQVPPFEVIDEKLQVELIPMDQVNFVSALAFSFDGTLLASGSADTTVRLWDTVTSNEVAILQKHTGFINVLAFSPNGKMLASGSTDKTVMLWDTGTGELLTTLTGHINSINTLAFSPDGSTLASGSTDGTIRFWNTETGDLLPPRITEHTKWVKVAFSKDDTTLAGVNFKGVITFWDLKTLLKTGSQTIGDPDFLMISAFSPDGTKFASIAGTGTTWVPDQVIRLIDVSTGHELASLAEPSGGAVSHLTFAPDGKTVAYGRSHKIILQNIETGKSLDISLLDENNVENNHRKANVKDVLEVPPGFLVLRQGVMPHQIPQISTFAFSPDGRKLVSGTLGGKVQMWNAETGLPLAPLLPGEEPDNGTARKEPDNFIITYQEPIIALAFSPDGVLLAVGSNKRIRMMGSQKQTRLKEVPHGSTALVFSPDNTMLITGLRFGGIELWDLATGDKLTTLDGHTEQVETLKFSPDGKTLVSTGHDGTILVWDWDKITKNLPVRDE